MANAATSTRAGTEPEKVTCITSSTGPMADQTLTRTLSGAAKNTTPLATPAHSGARLSDDERLTLARIKRNRRQGWMATFDEMDFLLGILERLDR